MATASIAPVSLPRLLDTSPDGIRRWADALALAVGVELHRIATARSAAPWSVASGAATLRAVDPATDTASDTAEQMAALVLDLQSKGIIA